jgi:tyrosyl-tRNA synthetase
MKNELQELLTRGVSEVIGGDELSKRLEGGEKLRIKLGIDPTSPHLHIGRAIPLLKLRDFQELGHQIVFIVGDFTAVIGDTSDKDSERPMLAKEEIEKNMQTYFDQVGKLIDLKKAELRHNSEWLEPLTYREIGEQADQFSVADFIARENIKRRLDAGKRVSLREVLYPMMQGYDSVAIKADVELGGTDQRFNLLAGRTLQTKAGQAPQAIIMNPLIDGLDGRKMSSSWGNTIPLTAEPREMYGKVMSMADEQVETYFKLCTRVPLAEVSTIVAGHPKESKMRLAREIVTLYHSAKEAEEAENEFVETFSKGGVPEFVPEIKGEKDALIADVLVSSGFLSSKSEWRRLADEGAVKDAASGEPLPLDAKFTAPITLKVGKHRFVRVVS